MHQSKQETITAIIPCLNEEKQIKRCIHSLSWCNKIQILWMGSDQTAKIAKSMGAEILEFDKPGQPDFVAVQKNINWAIDNATTDWLLRVDADEVVTKKLQNEILEMLRNPANHNFIAFGVPRKQYFLGEFLKGGDWAYDRLTRLFRPKFAYYKPLVKVHEQLKINGQIGYLKNYLLHYSHPDLKTLNQKFDTYTTLEASDLDDNYLVALWKIFFLPFYIFLRWLIWHKGYQDGIRGIVVAYFRAKYDFILYAKYLTKKRSN